MNAWLEDASQRPPALQLAGELWREGEIALLFGSTGDGKTAFAVQIANDIATGISTTALKVEACGRVLYFDFELSDAQHLSRYSFGGNTFRFSDQLIRVEMCLDDYMRGADLVSDWESSLLAEIEAAIIASGAKYVFIDNLTWLSRETDKGKFALPLMQRLVSLKKTQKISIFVMAHTPKRDETRPIVLNDLAGSRILANFADSVFAIGRSTQDPSTRYIKQVKARSAEAVYTTDNVALFTFEKRESFLGFQYNNTGSEVDHLRPLSDGAAAERAAQAKALADSGLTHREIAERLGVSLSTANKYVRRANGANTANEGEQDSDDSVIETEGVI